MKSAKQIANILGISPRTVEGHIQNILTKISANSQERVRNFAMQALELPWLKQHYIYLLTSNSFLLQISKFKNIFKNSDISCVVRYDITNEKAKYIAHCLKLTGIKIAKKPNKCATTTQKTIILLTEEYLLQLMPKEELNNIIFICLNETLWNSVKNHPSAYVITCFQEDQIHVAIIEIIKLLAPNLV